MDQSISFGNVVKEHRQSLDLTQAELARRVACATITIRKIEADALRPSIQIAERLATSLKIPMEERAAFVRLARTASLKTPTPQPLPTPPPTPEEIGLEDLSGRAIRGYELGDRMGEGGFGVVYRAVQPLVEREVAVKIILPRYADHPEFIRRFEAEAQLVARLEHPHIVPLYDYWREPSAAFLVMRLMRGGSLHAQLKEGPLSLEFILRLLHQVGGALFAAHRMGVIHRDLKPANILLDEDHNTYLADFGVAKNLGSPEQTSDTLLAGIIGSPAYISPEQIRAEPVRPQADIYALGVLLFQLLTGQQPFKGPTPIDYVQQHLNQPTPSLLEYNPNLPPELEPVLMRATAKAPEERYPDIPSLVSDFQSAIASTGVEIPGSVALDWLPADKIDIEALENPYKGLRAFEEADAEDFFGRETLVQDLLGRMSEENDLSRFLAVVGPSGSGKSSAVKAGLIPSLRRGGLPGSEHWFIVEFTPGAHPFEELETALLRVAVNPPESLLGQLRQDERGLLRAVQRILPPDKLVELVLVIDQFEELFTLVEDEETRAAFLESLVTALLDERSRLRLVVTLRADFTDRPLEYVDFGELLRQRAEFVLPLTPDELEQAITQPARGAGLVLEPGLSQRIIGDLGDQPGTLPLLQYALTELFERRAGRRLTLSAYQDSGGVLGALGKRAEQIYADLDPTSQETARQVFLRLVTLGEGVEDTRRRVLQAELEALTPDSPLPRVGEGLGVRVVLESFGRARLLSFDRDPLTRGPTVEVGHEALLREWPRLREWLDQSRADIRLERVLGNAAQEWQEAERDPSFLLRGSRLDQFAAWAEATDLALTQLQVEYLEASLEERRAREVAEAERLAHEAALERRSRNFLRALVGVFALAAVIAVALSIFAFQQRQTAQRQAGVLLASQAESELEDGFTDRAILLALEALENYPYTTQAEHALGQAVTHNRALQLYEGHSAAVTSADWSSDGKKVATSSVDNSVHIWDSVSGETINVINLPEGITGHQFDWALTVKWSPDDRYLLTISGDRFLLGSQDYDLILWDAVSGNMANMIEVSNDALPEAEASYFYHFVTGSGAAFAGNGRLATLGGDNTALVWDPLLKGQLLVLHGHTAAVNSLDWSPNFTRLATASEDGTIRIWDTNNGDELLNLQGHDGAVNQVAWSPKGDLLATAGDDGTVQFWDAESGENLKQIQVNESTTSNQADEGIVYSLAWSPDGDILATGSSDGYIRLWDVEIGEKYAEMKGHDNFVSYLSWSPADPYLLSTGADGTVRIWNTAPSNMVLRLPNYGYVSMGDWSPDERHFMVSTNAAGIVVWDMQTGLPSLETVVDKDTSWWWYAYYSPDGRFILAKTMDDLETGTAIPNKWYLLDSQTGEIIRMLETGKDTFLVEPGWSLDEQMIASGDMDGTFYFWDASTGELVKMMQCLSWAHIIRWSPDGRKIAMLCMDYDNQIDEIRVLDAQTYELLLTIESDMVADPFQWFNWSPDSSRIVVSGGNDEIGTPINPVYIFDAQTGKEQIKFVGHSGMVWAADWSPNGERIVSGSTDGTTRIWDVQTGAELLTLSTPTNWASLPSWSPDGQYLLTAIGAFDFESRSGVWRVWQSTQELIKYAKECCVFRQLTPEERQQFGLPPRDE